MSGIDVLEARLHMQQAKNALKAMRGELMALMADVGDEYSNPHWKRVCAQSQSLGRHLHSAFDALTVTEREEIDVDERREQVRETLWASR